MPVINMRPINTFNDDDHYKALMEREEKADKNYGTLRNYNSIPIWSTVAVQQEDRGLQTMKPL